MAITSVFVGASKTAIRFLTCAFLCIALRVQSTCAQDYETEVKTTTYKNSASTLFSKNGNSYVLQDLSGKWQVIRNAFQFDESIHPLPDAFSDATLLAISYYGTVFGVKNSTQGCELLIFTSRDQLLPTVPVSSDPSCSITSGASNVTDVFVFQISDSTSSRLLLFRGGTLETLWDSSLHTDVSGKLEGFAVNDLNTIGFTTSTLQRGKRQFSSFFWVPARGVNPIVLPRTASNRPIVRDVNNKNKYLLATPRGVSVFDPAKKRAVSYPFSANRLTSNGSPYTAATVFSTDGTRILASCFATGGLAGNKVEFASVNDERELLLVGKSPVGLKVAKVIPYTVKGYPRCTKARTTRRR
jgi:hypothetical protein